MLGGCPSGRAHPSTPAAEQLPDPWASLGCRCRSQDLGVSVREASCPSLSGLSAESFVDATKESRSEFQTNAK